MENIPTRTDSQIRAHHQKMLKKYKSLEDIEGAPFVEVEGLKDLVPKVERVVGLLEMIVGKGLKLPKLDVEEILRGVEVREGGEDVK